MPAATLTALLSGLVDYAGLFPPASLSLGVTGQNYAAYRQSGHAWMLGRLIVPATRLAELAALRTSTGSPERWPVSVLLGDAAADEAGMVARMESARLECESVEFRFTSAETASAIRKMFSAEVELYAEIPLTTAAAGLRTLAEMNIRAKVRTGGIVESAFPAPSAIATFLEAAAGVVPVKFTAGLHHPLRAAHRLTYASDAPTGTMHGFLNVFVAACFAQAGFRDDLDALLQEQELGALRFTDDQIAWRGQRISLAQVKEARAHFARSFGSCSFAEPQHDLETLGLL